MELIVNRSIYNKFLIINIIVLFTMCKTQVSTENKSDKLIEADKLFNEGKINESLYIYENILRNQDPDKDREHFYKLACIYSLLNKKNEAFKVINKSIRKDSTQWILEDPYLFNLTSDKRWISIEKNQLKKVYSKQKINIDKDLFRLSFQLFMRDQSFYYEKQYFENKEKFIKIKEKINDENIQKLDSIIKKDGFPTLSRHGDNFITVAFLIIQHSSLDVQKKYLKIIEENLSNNNFPKYLYAYLKDRVLIRSDKKQIFGTQLEFDIDKQRLFFNKERVEDIENIDVRRKEFGMESISNYLLESGIRWIQNETKLYSDTN